MLALVYILKNQINRYYVGITSLDIKKRLERHNRGEVMSTKKGRPWHVVYIESYKSMQEARGREKKIKSWHGGNAFKSFLARAAGSSNGRTHPSGGWYLGSSPSPAALAGNKSAPPWRGK